MGVFMSENDKESRKRVRAWRVATYEAIRVTSELVDLLVRDKISSAIVETLVKSLDASGLRYNELYRQTQATLDNKRGINQLVKTKQNSKKISLTQTTFDKHLKKLMAIKVVTRIEETRYNVRYQTPLAKTLNEVAMDMKLKMQVKEAEDMIGTWGDAQEIIEWSNVHDKEKRIATIETYIRLGLHLVAFHLLECMSIGVAELQEGKFVKFSSMLAETYREIMLKILAVTVYLSGAPEVQDCLAAIMKELPEGFRRQTVIK
jgi:DNA-binding transcriptional ArsR family regulator